MCNVNTIVFFLWIKGIVMIQIKPRIGGQRRSPSSALENIRAKKPKIPPITSYFISLNLRIPVMSYLLSF